MEYIHTIILLVIGFAAGWIIADYKRNAERNATKTKRLNKIKDATVSRLKSKLGVGYDSVSSVIQYYQKFSPDLFNGITDKDLQQLVITIHNENPRILNVKKA